MKTTTTRIQSCAIIDPQTPGESQHLLVYVFVYSSAHVCVRVCVCSLARPSMGLGDGRPHRLGPCVACCLLPLRQAMMHCDIKEPNIMLKTGDFRQPQVSLTNLCHRQEAVGTNKSNNTSVSLSRDTGTPT